MQNLESELWTPWLWDKFPPAARVCVNPVPSEPTTKTIQKKQEPKKIEKKKWTKVTTLTNEFLKLGVCDDEKKTKNEESFFLVSKKNLPTTIPSPPPPQTKNNHRKMGFQYIRPMDHHAGKTDDELASVSYNVICALAVDNVKPEVADAWCDFALYQNQTIGLVCCMIISKIYPEGIVRYFSPKDDDENEYGTFRELKTILDNANRIYCYDDVSFYGLLRASPVDVVDVSDTYQFPASTLPNEAEINPFLPTTDSPYYSYMARDIDFPKPTIHDAEGCTVATHVMEPDDQWEPTEDQKNWFGDDDQPKNKKNEKEKEASSSSSLGGGLGGSMSYNQEDSPQEVKLYLSSKRWFGARDVHKPPAVYFRGGILVHWMFKTYSVTSDLQVDCSMFDLMKWNAHQDWWSDARFCRSKFVAPTGFHRSRAYNEDTRVPDWLSQTAYTLLFQQKRLLEIEAVLEYEVRTLVDIMTAIHVNRSPVTCYISKFNEDTKRYDNKWVNCTITMACTGVLHGSQKPCPSPEEQQQLF